MTEPTPPPERPLPDDSRARIRAELLAHAHDHRSNAPRWLVPVGAAAAVALVAGLSFWAVSSGSSEPEGLPVTGGGSSSAAPTPKGEPSHVPSNEGTSTPTVASSVPASGKPEGNQVGTGTCEGELENVLEGAEQAYAVDDVSYWVKGDQYSLCYRIEGSTTVTRPLRLTDALRDDVAAYRVISLFPPTRTGYRTVRVAGGPVPEGSMAFDVEYTFPDGHMERSTTSTDDSGHSWWRMVYAYDDGGGNELKQPEIQVTVSLSGAQRHYSLTWATDTCAQANHGC